MAVRKVLERLSDTSIVTSKIAAKEFYSIRGNEEIHEIFKLFLAKDLLLPGEIFWSFVDDVLTQRSGPMNFNLISHLINLCITGDLMQRLRSENKLKKFFLSFKGVSKFRKIIGLRPLVGEWDKSTREFFIYFCCKEGILGLSRVFFQTADYEKFGLEPEYQLVYLGAAGADGFIEQLITRKHVPFLVKEQFLKIGLLKKIIKMNRGFSCLNIPAIDYSLKREIPDFQEFQKWDLDWKKIFVSSVFDEGEIHYLKVLTLLIGLPVSEVDLFLCKKIENILSALRPEDLPAIHDSLFSIQKGPQLTSFLVQFSSPEILLAYWETICTKASLGELIMVLDKVCSRTKLNSRHVDFINRGNPHLLWIYLQSQFCHLYQNLDDLLEFISSSNFTSMNRLEILIQLKKRNISTVWKNEILSRLLPRYVEFSLNEWFEFLQVFEFNPVVLQELLRFIGEKYSEESIKNRLTLLAISSSVGQSPNEFYNEVFNQIGFKDFEKFAKDFPERAILFIKQSIKALDKHRDGRDFFRVALENCYDLSSHRNLALKTIIENPRYDPKFGSDFLNDALRYGTRNNMELGPFLNQFGSFMGLPDSFLMAMSSKALKQEFRYE